MPPTHTCISVTPTCAYTAQPYKHTYMKKMPQNPNYETQLSVLLDLRGQRTEMGGLRWQGGELVGEKREDLERALFCGRETVLQRAPDQDKLKGGESLAQRAENHPLSLSQDRDSWGLRRH